MKVVIIDYEMGNIKSISSALKFLGVSEIVISNQRDDILTADKLILPGVGSFAKAMGNIKDLRIDEYLTEAVVANKKPILGICLGMQLMCESSEEDGFSEGLGFISGKVERFSSKGIKVPHVGFNQVSFADDSRLYKGMENLSDFYFTHSFKMTSNAHVNQAHCNYGSEFIASYEVANIAGAQFHPELSQTNGLKMIDNFFKSF
jgi:imidazole glycerol-phosphate synthase subunit HisH